MAKNRYKGLHKVRARGHGYTYHRASGRQIFAAPGTRQFDAEFAAAEASIKGGEALPGTLGAAIAAYRKSPFWSQLRPATKKSYGRAIEILERVDKSPLVQLTPAFVAQFRDRIFETRGLWMANYIVVVLRLVLDCACERDLIKDNPARKVRRLRKPKGAPRANRPWTQIECRAALKSAPPYLRVTIALGMCAGLRKRDVLTALKSAIKDNKIEVRTSKRGRVVRVPLHAELKRALVEAPQHSAPTIAANSYGVAWTESGFNSSFCKFIRRLQRAGKVEPGLTFHGLRHTLGTRLKEAGADDRAIADLLGQSSLAMANHYSRDADTSPRDARLIELTDLAGNEDED